MYSLFFHRWLMTELDGLPRKMAVQKAGNMLYKAHIAQAMDERVARVVVTIGQEK